jgi:hypothetical protein
VADYEAIRKEEETVVNEDQECKTDCNREEDVDVSMVKQETDDDKQSVEEAIKEEINVGGTIDR